jgi:peptidoglycan pentaglycine glycine transferase (the first glycine)
MPRLNAAEWDQFLMGHPTAHLLQTAAWGELKAAFGWRVARVRANEQAGAQVLFRPLPFGRSIAYIPRGPVGQDWQSLWPEVDAICWEHKAVLLKIEPDEWEPLHGDPPGPPPGFRKSPHAIQPPRTLLVDLKGDESQILEGMRQKTRYNVRLALKKGVVVRPSSDLEAFYALMQITGERDRFGVHSLEYFTRAYELFHPLGMCELFVAESGGQPLAGLMAFGRGPRAWYFYGASADRFREYMPTYALQWEVMRWARQRGCVEYDLWGVPDVDEASLEAQFTQRADGLWGVYRFKRGFGGVLRRSAGPWDRVYSPLWYALYSWRMSGREG